MLKGIVFDLDGTLVNSLKATFDGFNHTFQAFGAPVLTPHQIMEHFGPGERQIFEKILGIEHGLKAQKLYHDYTRSRMHESPLFEGIHDVLNTCHRLNLPTSIVTGRGRDGTKIILEHHGLLDRFVSVICHEDVSSSKPSPEGILKATQLMNLDPTQIAYVGDMWVDIRAAKRAGSHAISVAWDPIHDFELCQKEEPHFTAKSPEDLIRYILNNHL